MLQKWLEGKPPIQVIEINQVWNDVIKLIGDAKEELVLVSPYNEYSVPLTEEVAKAAKTVRVVAVCREEQKKQEDKHFEWLRSIGADVHLVSRLHAKIYYNESTAIVTSMNLLKGSATDSKEFGFIINDSRILAQIREYVQEGLMAYSKQLAPPRKVAKPRTSTARLPKTEPKQVRAKGFCIRCKEEGILYNRDRPLCPKCFRAWDKFKNPDFPEKHCHRCGKTNKTSFTKPLCPSCYKESD